MYKIDDEFRPPGRVFMKATRETNGPELPVRKSSLKKGPPITTNLDNRNIQFQHEVSHEKTVEALITEYPPLSNSHHHQHQSNSKLKSITNGNDLALAIPSTINNREEIKELQAITKNKRVSSDVLGNSFETIKTSQRTPDGNRRITTHILRKVTTISRAEESLDSQNLIREAKNTQTSQYGYESTQAIEPKRPKVDFYFFFFEMREDLENGLMVL